MPLVEMRRPHPESAAAYSVRQPAAPTGPPRVVVSPSIRDVAASNLLDLVREHRDEIQDAVERHRGLTFAVFGSEARGEDTDAPSTCWFDSRPGVRY